MTFWLNGRVSWLCPHCGARNRGVEFVFLDADRRTKLRSLTDIVEVHENTVVRFACVGPARAAPPDAPPASFLCPNCLREVTAPEIRGGFHRWLEEISRGEEGPFTEICTSLDDEEVETLRKTSPGLFHRVLAARLKGT
jgi:hypothetical protein